VARGAGQERAGKGWSSYCRPTQTGGSELFEEGWEDTLHREDGTAGRETNGMYIDNVVDLKAM